MSSQNADVSSIVKACPTPVPSKFCCILAVLRIRAGTRQSLTQADIGLLASYPTIYAGIPDISSKGL